MVGDFNLHHPSWGGAHCLTQHGVADCLIEVVEAVDLDLALPLGTTVVVHTISPDQVRLIGSTGLDSGLVLVERSVKEWVGVLRDSGGGLL